MPVPKQPTRWSKHIKRTARELPQPAELPNLYPLRSPPNTAAPTLDLNRAPRLTANSRFGPDVDGEMSAIGRFVWRCHQSGRPGEVYGPVLMGGSAGRSRYDRPLCHQSWAASGVWGCVRPRCDGGMSVVSSLFMLPSILGGGSRVRAQFDGRPPGRPTSSSAINPGRRVRCTAQF